MAKYPVVIIGASELVTPFAILGAITHETTDSATAAVLLTKYSGEQLAATVFISEGLAQELLPQIEKIKQLPLPAVMIVPEHGNKQNIGVQRLQNTLIKAIGKAL